LKHEDQLFHKFGQVFPAGTVLFEEGQPCLGMFLIQKGRVRLFKKAGEKEVTIDILHEGDFFGEMACLIGQPRSLNAVVEEGSQILVVDAELLDDLFRRNPGMGLKVVGNLAGRLRKAYQIIEALTADEKQPAEKE
jgi:CRP/FNR family transcriptional regulator, cyclic AMP receptor protein